jgi:chromosome segregation ATPase
VRYLDHHALRWRQDPFHGATALKLQFHRAVLAAEIQKAPLPDNRLPQLDNAIKNMRDNVSRMLNEADSTEEEIEKLKLIKEEFEQAIAALREDEIKTDARIIKKQEQLNRIDAEREVLLAELVKEKALEAQLKERNHDIATMQYRLSDEYQEVFKRTPSRTNKI